MEDVLTKLHIFVNCLSLWLLTEKSTPRGIPDISKISIFARTLIKIVIEILEIIFNFNKRECRPNNWNLARKPQSCVAFY